MGCRLLDCSHFDWHEMAPHCGFDLHFSDNEWCWASFHVFFSHLYVFFAASAAAKLLQSCPTLWDPVDCSLPGSSIHGIFQARVLEWGVHILILINIWNWLMNTKNYNCLSSFEVLWQNNRNWAAYKQWKLMPHIFGYWKFEIWCQNGQGRDVFWFSSCTFYVM